MKQVTSDLRNSHTESHQGSSRDECFPALPDPVPGFVTKVDMLIQGVLNAVGNFEDWEKELGLTPKR